MQALLQAVYEYGFQFVLLVGVMLLGLNLGKFLRIRKDSKKDKEI